MAIPAPPMSSCKGGDNETLCVHLTCLRDHKLLRCLRRNAMNQPSVRAFVLLQTEQNISFLLEGPASNKYKIVLPQSIFYP